MAETVVPAGRTERVHIDKVVPYWRNPRRLSQEAVEAVGRSIQEYGYAQPVVVDSDYTIIIGHTRYAALRRMDVEEIDILVADHLKPQQVKQLRVIDNRSGEYAFWDFEKLSEEVSAKDSELLFALFPELAHINEAEVTRVDSFIDDPTAQHGSWDEVDPTVEFVCPTCFHEFEVDVTREQIMSGRINAEEKN